jgi:flagellar hook-basal body complex protein FliE
MEISNASLLTKMKIDAMRASGDSSISAGISSGGTSFQDALKGAIENVVESQEVSKDLGNKFASGDNSVSLVDAKIASNIAEVKTQILISTTQKVLKAYRDISTMSI